MKRQRERRAWLHNGLIIAMQAVLQLPSLLCLLWYSSMAMAGNIRFESSTSAATIATSPTSVYFYGELEDGAACIALGRSACPPACLPACLLGLCL